MLKKIGINSPRFGVKITKIFDTTTQLVLAFFPFLAAILVFFVGVQRPPPASAFFSDDPGWLVQKSQQE